MLLLCQEINDWYMKSRKINKRHRTRVFARLLWDVLEQEESKRIYESIKDRLIKSVVKEEHIFTHTSSYFNTRSRIEKNELFDAPNYSLITTFHRMGYIDEDEWAKWILSEDLNYRPKLNSNATEGKKPARLILVEEGVEHDISKNEGIVQTLINSGILKISEYAKFLKGETFIVRLEKKPPVGLYPRFLHDEKRLKQIIEAKERYSSAGIDIPNEWHVEESVLFEYLSKRKS